MAHVSDFFCSVHSAKMLHFPRVFPTAALKQPAQVKARQHVVKLSAGQTEGQQHWNSTYLALLAGPIPLTYIVYYRDDPRLSMTSLFDCPIIPE